jgi:hypothetical protein
MPDSVAVRDSKNPSGAMLSFPRATWATFVQAVKQGDFSG